MNWLWVTVLVWLSLGSLPKGRGSFSARPTGLTGVIPCPLPYAGPLKFLPWYLLRQLPRTTVSKAEWPVLCAALLSSPPRAWAASWFPCRPEKLLEGSR